MSAEICAAGSSNGRASAASAVSEAPADAGTAEQPQIVLDIDLGAGDAIDGLTDAVGRLKVPSPVSQLLPDKHGSEARNAGLTSRSR